MAFLFLYWEKVYKATINIQRGENHLKETL